MEDVLKSQRWYKEMGWHFDENNDFVDKDGNLFDFESQQDHYEFVHVMIKTYIFKELERRYNFKQYPVPSRRSARRARNDPYCPQVFVTEDVFINPNLLVIVQGLGEVPPGQWARKQFTNGKRNQWKLATQFPFIERALHLGWAVILCDPNHNECKPKTQSTRAHHVRRVWEDIVRKSDARCVMYIGFSAGTTAILDLYSSIRQEFMKRVKGIALMDGENGRNMGSWLEQHSWSFRQKSFLFKPAPNEEYVDTTDHDSVPGMAVGQSVILVLKLL
ncbi:hypothetical protein BGZ46_009304 [Entomortierella lignicola]|nr:hypothetical protein BGZ46_009304 [Entomortierella lignicola]